VYFFSENRALYEKMWKCTVEPDETQMTIRRMRIPCWILKAKNTHAEYVILTAFPRQQWLHERASVLRFYVDCLSLYVNETVKSLLYFS
jgi:hypothetical protein